MSCEVVNVKDENGIETPVVHYAFQPTCKDKLSTIINANLRLCERIPEELAQKIHYSPVKDEFPLTGSGKRDINALTEQGIANTFTLSYITKSSNNKKVHKEDLKSSFLSI